MDKKCKQPAIGIDLGTTYSCVAVWQRGKVDVIPNDQGNRTTPSCVAFTPTERFVGDAAKNQATVNSSNTIFDAKRLIGRRFNDETLQKDMRLWPFQVVEREDDPQKKPMVVVNYKREEKQFTAEEISAMILTKMKEVSEDFLDSPVKDAVITVPAYFNNLQRQATKDAGTIAGLNVLRIINEPTAAAIAYGLDKNVTACTNVLVFDLGGGTFDVSLISMEKGLFEVIAVNGNTHLGGGDFDHRIVDHLIAEFRRKYGKDMSGDARAIGRLRTACERAKRTISSTTSTDIDIDCLFDGIDFSTTITRAKFEKLNMDLFEECMLPVEKCIADAKMTKDDVHETVLVGGSSRIPMVQQLLRDFFGGKELRKSINPDEAVACGAALYAAMLSGVDNSDFVVLDVTPFSIGCEDYLGNMAVILPRNTPIPAKSEEMKFTTIEDDQDETAIIVYEGESPIAKANNFLGEFDIGGIPPAPKGVPTIVHWIEIDTDGIMKYSAKDMTTGNKNDLVITNYIGRLRKEEIDKMMKDAEKFKVAEQQHRQKINAMTALEKYMLYVSAMLRRNSRKIGRKDRRKMEDAVGYTTKWLDWNYMLSDACKFDDKLEELECLCEPIIAKMHQQTLLSQNLEIIDVD